MVIFVIGLGCLLFVLPQGLVGRYQPLLASNGLTNGQVCRLGVNGTSEVCFADYGGQWYYMLIFFMGQLLMGAGTTPLYTLGPAYIDENVHPKSSPVYLAVFFSLTLLGPGLGFISGGSLLNIYIDVTQVNVLSYSLSFNRKSATVHLVSSVKIRRSSILNNSNMEYVVICAEKSDSRISFRINFATSFFVFSTAVRSPATF